MITNMEDYVTYEQAKKLKELGFDWECKNLYLVYYDDGVCFLEYPLTDHEEKFIQIPAPTLAQAQKWLREVKGIIVCIEPRFYKGKKPLVGYDYHLFNKDDGWFSHIDSETVYDTYEQALSAGIDRALELLKQN